ncbi:MAG: hypothetical protein GY817_03895 [bacterium]|nr:hypothetical protein [bacterium]
MCTLNKLLVLIILFTFSISLLHATKPLGIKQLSSGEKKKNNIDKIKIKNLSGNKKSIRRRRRQKLTIKQTYEKFSSNFKSKKFNLCLQYLSGRDFRKYQEIAKLNNWQGSVEELLIKDLRNLWYLYFDEAKKKSRIKSLEDLKERDIEEMEKSLKYMQKEGVSLSEINMLKNQIVAQNFDIEEQLLLLKGKANIFMEIEKRKILKNKALVSTGIEYSFPRTLWKKTQEIMIDKANNSYNISKIRKFNKGILKMYVLYAFEKNDQGKWKILFFSRDQFDSTDFNEFIVQYEIFPEEKILEINTYEETA